MARLYEIKKGNIRAQVAPDNGGMLASLQIGGLEVLPIKEQNLALIPMMAGGIPLMFPFSSRTRDDHYFVDGKEYGMPMHGLLKNAAFGIKSIAEDRVTLFMENNAAWLSTQYPYPFHLELTYQAEENAVKLIASVTNTGDTPLPHAIGWHPFFKATDKAKIKLTHSFTVHYDYWHDVDMGEAPLTMDLSAPWDDVFHTPKQRYFLLENPVDGYTVRCDFDEAFHVFVVCTTVDGAVVAEPWCDLPNAANLRRFTQVVAPSETKEYAVTFTLTKTV